MLGFKFKLCPTIQKKIIYQKGVQTIKFQEYLGLRGIELRLD